MLTDCKLIIEDRFNIPLILKIEKFKPLIFQMNITLQSRFISFLNDITTHVSVRKRLVQKSSNIQTFIYYMYVILTPRWVASFLKGSLLSRTLYSIGTALSTVVNRSRFDSRRRS